MSRVLIIGLDGASFDLLTPWCREGKLPALAAMLKDGAHGELQSTIPPMSPPAWTSFVTGKNPGKHGIFDFTMRKAHSYGIEFVNARWRKAETMWKIMSDAGKRVCVLSVPMSYPPETINGVMISGIDAPGVKGLADPTAVHPVETYHELMERVGGYLISPNFNAFDSSQCDEMVGAALATVERKMETALYLFQKEPWDCFMVTIGETDGIAHRLWKYHDPRSPLSDDRSVGYTGADPILRVYQRVDEYVGRLRRLADDETTVIIMSDHGHGGNGIKAVYLNTWLESKGLLRFKTNGNNRVVSSAIHVAKNLALKTLPPAFKKLIFRKTQLANKIESSFRFSHIDWRETKAYSEETPYYPGIWINLRGRDPAGIVGPGEDYEGVRQRIIDELSKWSDPETGRRVVKMVHRREDVYTGPFVGKSPDLCIEWNLDGEYSYLFKRSNGRRSTISRLEGKEKETSKSGDHRDYGILMAAGKSVKGRMRLDEANLMDLAPTILHLVGLPIPSDMDGKVLTQIIADEWRSAHPVTYCAGSERVADLPEVSQSYASEEDEEAVKARLRGLGYME